MKLECIKNCETMSIGQRGTFKKITSANGRAQYVVKLENGNTVRVPVNCCRMIKLPVASDSKK